MPQPKICRKKPGPHLRDTIRAFASSSWKRLAAGLPARRNARKKHARRAEFRDNNHQYDENSNFNTRADREARAAVMKQYWENRRTNS